MTIRFWLKTKTDIDSHGYGYDEYSLSVDSNTRNIGIGSPERLYDFKKIIGNGVFVTGGDFYSNRTIKINIRFGRTTADPLDDNRAEIYQKYFASVEDVYLCRQYLTRVESIKVFPVVKDETYQHFFVSDEVDIELVTELPFWEESALQEVLFSKTEGSEISLSITNGGMITPVIWTGVFSSGATYIEIGVRQNFGIKITEAFEIGQTLRIDSRDFSIWLNGAQMFDYDISGTPFAIHPGSNILRMFSDGNFSGSVQYNRRFW